jgi:PAS domain S-box-containing protein
MQTIPIVSIVIQLAATAWSVVELRRQRDWRMGVFTALLAVMALYRILALRTPRGPDPAAEIASDVAALATTTLAILATVFVGVLLREKQRMVDSLQANARCLRRECDLSDSIINALPGVFYLYDQAGHFQRWNLNFEAVSGYSATEMAERHPLDFFDGADKLLLAERINQVFLTGQGEVEAEFVGKNGQRRPYYFNGVRAEFDGRPCLIGLGLDITDRKRTELARQVSEDRIRLFIDHAPASLAMFDCDMRYISVSRRWLTDYGLREVDVIGRSHYEVFPEIPKHWRAIHCRGLKGETVRSDEDRFERADGSLQWLRWEVRPWYITGDVIGGIVIFTEDITERKRAEEALRESSERLRLALDAAHMGIFDWNLPLDQITWSRWHEELWGFHPGEFGGTYAAFSQRVHPDDLPAVNAEVSRCLAARDRFSHEFRVVWPDDSVHWITGVGEFEFGPDGQPLRMRGAVIETTERKLAETERDRLLFQEQAAHAEAETARLILANTLERIGDAFVALDRDWRYTYVNEKAARIFGRSREELIGRHIWTEFPEGIGQSFHLAYERAIAEQVPIEIEEYYPPYDRWFENRIYPSPDGLSIAFHDITDRKRAEAALRESDARLRLAIESANIGFWDWDLHTNQVYYSPEWKNQLGYTDRELGNDYEEWKGRLHPEDLQPTLNILQQALAAPWPKYEAEFRLRHKDGTYRWILTQAALIRNDTGEPRRMLGSHIDITQRKSAERALIENEYRLRSIMDSLHAFVGLLTPEGIIREANREPLERAGLIRADVIGKPVVDSYWFSHSRAVQEQLSDAIQRAAQGETLRFDIPIRMLGDQIITIDFAVVPFRDPNGKVIGLVPSAVDVTERVRAEQALRSSRERLARLSRQLITAQETERRHLARELHDEIGQVLTAVHISLQQARGTSSPPAWPRLDEADGIVDRAIQQVRAMSLNLRPAMLDDFGLVAAVRWLVERQQRPECPIELSIQCCGLPLDSDLSTACYRCIQEALTNVRRHARAGHIWVDLTHTPEGIRVRVRDDGVGCDVRAIQERAVAGHSFGVLGMQERVELLGGRFTFESVPGQGTALELELPVPAEADDADETSNADQVSVGSERP